MQLPWGIIINSHCLYLVTNHEPKTLSAKFIYASIIVAMQDALIKTLKLLRRAGKKKLMVNIPISCMHKSFLTLLL